MANMPMTASGVKKLRAELDHLKRQARPEVIAAIAEAREHGDLRENAEYHAAKEQQSFIEGRIRHLDHVLSVAQVIDIMKLPNEGRVIFGVTDEVLNLDTQQRSTYTLVGHEEADISEHKLSIASPLARALIGHEVGDEVVVSMPDQEEAVYEICKVEHLGDSA